MKLYGKLFKNILFPLFESIKGRNTVALMKDSERRLEFTTEQLKQFQFQRLQALLMFCQQHVPYYQKLWQQLDIDVASFTSVKDIEKLPLLTKQIVADNYQDLVADNANNNIKKSTGGSTGRPFHFELDIGSYEARQAIMWRGYGWAGAGLGIKTWYLWGVELKNVGVVARFKDFLYNRFHNRVIANSFSLNQHNYQQYIDSINAYQPEAIVGYVSPLYELAKYINEHNVDVYSVKRIVTGAESLLYFQRQEIEKAFGCNVINTYGCREFMLIAAECNERNNLHINIDHLVVETVAEHGEALNNEVGDVVVTDLANYGMPLIRYVNGDQAMLSGDTCQCGNPLPLMSKITGRRLDIIVGVNGEQVPGEFFPHLFKDYVSIKRFQVVQKNIDSLDIYYQINDGFEQAVLDDIKVYIQNVLGENMSINFHQQDEIYLTSSGKYRVTKSEIL